MKSFNLEFLKFLFFGGLNTLSSYALYTVLQLIFAYPAAYTASYIWGIFFSYFLNSRYVFRAEMQVRKAVQYPLVYLVQYLMGLGLLFFMVEIIHVNKLFAPILIIFITLPITFVLSRGIIKGAWR